VEAGDAYGIGQEGYHSVAVLSEPFLSSCLVFPYAFSARRLWSFEYPQTSHALLCRALARETLWGMAGPRACDKIKSPSHISMTLIGYRPEALPW
jgi:hypothetical protein